MSVVHISEEEAIRDFGSVLARIDAGDDVFVDRADSCLRVAPQRKIGRTVKEMLAILDSLPGEHGVVDEDFAADVRQFRERHQEGFDPARWD